MNLGTPPLGAPADASLDDILDNVDKQVVFQLEAVENPFIGRVTELSSLQWFHADKKFVVITGERGVGKTELAKKYAHDYKTEHSANVIWINSTTITQMVADFKSLHSSNIGDFADKKITAIIRSVFDNFKSRNTLYVFDGAEKDNVLLKQLKVYIGDNQLNKIIVTSRSDDWDTAVFTKLPLTVFPKADSVKFIKIALKDIDIPTDESKCEELAGALGNLPLALKKSTGYITKINNEGKRYTIDNFLAQLNGNELSTTEVKVYVVEDEEVEQDLISKITEESSKIGEKIASGATQAWEKVSDGASYVGSQVAYGAKQAGKEISNAAKSVETSVKKFFSGFG